MRCIIASTIPDRGLHHYTVPGKSRTKPQKPGEGFLSGPLPSIVIHPIVGQRVGQTKISKINRPKMFFNKSKILWNRLISEDSCNKRSKSIFAFRHLQRSFLKLLPYLLLDMFLNIFNRRQLLLQFRWQITGDLILTDANRLAHIFQRIFHNQAILAFA